MVLCFAILFILALYFGASLFAFDQRFSDESYRIQLLETRVEELERQVKEGNWRSPLGGHRTRSG